MKLAVLKAASPQSRIGGVHLHKQKRSGSFNLNADIQIHEYVFAAGDGGRGGEENGQNMLAS